jgi:hypothetical protein
MAALMRESEERDELVETDPHEALRAAGVPSRAA